MEATGLGLRGLEFKRCLGSPDENKTREKRPYDMRSADNR